MDGYEKGNPKVPALGALKDKRKDAKGKRLEIIQTTDCCEI
jgi:hypothetical protein